MADLFPYLGLPGPDLLQRDFGRRAYPVLEQELLQVPSGRALWLDFSGVSVMDTSFADETVLELALGLVSRRLGDRFLGLAEPSLATLDNLEATIAWRRAKVALLAKEESGQLAVVGHVERNLVEAWHLAREEGELTARQLADRLGLEINTASMRLRKLYDARLLTRREEVTSEGRQHVYRIWDGQDEPGEGAGGSSPTGSDCGRIFDWLWNELSAIIGTPAAAALLRRALAVVKEGHPDFPPVAITRERLTYTYRLPAELSADSSGECVPAFKTLVAEVLGLAGDLTGGVLVRRLTRDERLRVWSPPQTKR